jgi:hypothetical protein
MNDLLTLVEKLRNNGIQPIIAITVDAGSQDIQAIKTLHASLKSTGVPVEVHINLPAEQAPGSQPALTTSQPLAASERLSVTVKETRLNCFTFRKIDKAGKPEMVFVQPRIQLQNGTKFFVSSSHKVSDKDPGNGIVFGTGNLEFYLIVDCPSNPAAVGSYVRKMDVSLTPG